MVIPSRRRELAQKALMDIRTSCKLFSIGETWHRYKEKLSDENTGITDQLLRLTQDQLNWGFGLCVLYLRNMKGYGSTSECIVSIEN